MSDSPTASRPGMMEPLRLREFRLLLTGFIVGQSMMPLQFVASIAWIQFVADDSVEIIMVGAIGTIRGIGMIGFGLFGGALADRFDRRRLLMVTQAVAFVANMLIAVVMWTGSGGTTEIIIFFALTIVASSAHAIDGPTRNAITPEILGPRLTPSGIALNSAAMQFAMPIAIFASGLMIDHLGHGAVFAISSLGHLGEVFILAMMSYRTVFSAAHLASRGQGPGQAIRDIRDGFRYARSKAVILWTVLIVVLMMSLIMPPTGTLGPQWVTTVVGASWSQFSYIAVFWGGGAMIASLFLVRFSWIERKGLLTGLGVIVMALGFVVFTNPPTVINAMMGNLLLGVGMSIAMVSANATLAYETPNEIRGRIMGLIFLGMGIAQAVGLPLGAVAQSLTMETLFPPMSYAVLAILAVIIVLRPVILRARVPQHPPEPIAQAVHAGRSVLNGAATFILRAAPNKART
ncbi:MAG: MFS transporter [Chloroflexota bacterium]|nr:MFS transporter [Chloroflexota bacterium]MDE2896158.1 MFS transporter [Chloroflexota bacterium]